MAPPVPPNPPSNHPPQPASLAGDPQGNRCEIIPKVRSIAQRTQIRMFQRTGLFFNEATFQVPNTVDEAFENMHLGTTDLDRTNSESTEGITDLYLLSWSNTQFFSAQMAALGFRFVSCNLRKKPGLKEPPPVDKWLRLERFSAPLARRPPAAQQTTPAPTSKPPLPPAQNAPKPSTTPLPPQSLKRPQQSSERAPSPPTKHKRNANGIRVPSAPAPPSQPSKRNVISSSNKPPHNSTQPSVPIIDLT